MKTVLMAALTAAVALYSVTSAHAIDIYKSKEFSTTIEITGRIEYGDEAFLLQVLQERRSKGHVTEFALLDSGGGNMHAGMEMALLLRGWGVKTVVGSEQACASACMLMYAGGVERYAWQGALLGVHGASTSEHGYDEEFSDGTVRLAKMMAFLGAPAEVVALLVVTSSDDITWLNNSAVQGWVQILDPRQEQHVEQQQTTGNERTMTCHSADSGNQYGVVWNDYGLTVNGKPFAIKEWHEATKERGAYVVNGRPSTANTPPSLAGLTHAWRSSTPRARAR